jgi:membrane protein implicated in regulation of membrane protease activity
MPEWLPHVSQFTVFLAIAAVGFLFLLISLLFGEMFEHGFDHDLGHGGPGFLSTRVLSVFVTAFGGFGAIATYYDLGILPSSGVGLVSGVLFALPIYFLARFLYGQQASTDVHESDLVGIQARVIVGIPAGGVGQVRCRIGEQLVDKIARSADGSAIPENTAVKIETVLGETVVVRQ